ncbi:MAG: division/cell wall cluster transcriptional repressor MraZ [Clostridiales bacterium]|nr:division/cell wall cluster transcriptional repressor MraZ [Clostridiales bacterium]
MDLLGKYTHALDAKNRVFFPAKFREDLGSPIVITVNVDGCLSAYSLAEWSNYTEKLKELPKTQVRDITRFICGNAQKSVPDGQGRVMLSKDLVEYAGLTEEVTFIGCGDRVELWASESAQIPDMYDKEKVASIRDLMLEYGL